MAEPDATENTRPDIEEFFTGKTVFITGATGFLGKVLLEKLLRSCKGIEEIFVLIRPSIGYGAKARLDKLLKSKVFEKIYAECPEVLEKLVPISGDITRYNLEMGEAEMQLVCNNVNVVIHAAATIKFDEKARKSLSINLLGTKLLLNICHKMKNIMAFVYVSTAYSFCNWQEVMEYTFPEEIQPNQVLSMIEWMPEHILDKVLDHVLNDRPSVYHFGKAMSEIYLSHYRGNIPVSIIRPSMITAAWKEPFPGWIDSFAGPNGLIIACGKGVLRTVLVKTNIIADLIPVDIVVNTIIAAAREVAITNRTNMLIVNCTSTEKKITWGQMEKICYPLIVKYPSMGLFRHPGGSFKNNYYSHRISIWTSHLLPAYLTDIVLYPFENSDGMIAVYGRVHRLLKLFEYFTTKKIDFQSENKRMMHELMSPEDKATFRLDMADFQWKEYMDNYVLGIRRHLLRESDETLPKARSKMIRSYYLWLVIKSIPFAFGLWYLQKKTNFMTIQSISFSKFFFDVPVVKGLM